MALDQQLLEILACPDTHHAPLEHDAGAQTLTCTECGRIFEIRDDIPILLLDEAREPGSPAASGPAGPAGSPDAAGSSDDSVKGSN
ncbi:Trm112 family protein [Actinoplanes philippinensis]|uniref:Trm112 family protein n=1 Tax=Actinoplanes philippinensis TaxID=35752 RepID=UPI0033DF92C9